MMNAAMQQCFSLLHYTVSHLDNPWMELARYNIFTKTKRNPKVLALPQNICKSYATQHVTFLKGTPIMKVIQVCVSLEMKYLYGSLLKVILLHLSYFSVSAKGKKYSIEASGCHKQYLSCTPFCKCPGGQDCLNTFTATREIAQ